MRARQAHHTTQSHGTTAGCWGRCSTRTTTPPPSFWRVRASRASEDPHCVTAWRPVGRATHAHFQLSRKSMIFEKSATTALPPRPTAAGGRALTYCTAGRCRRGHVRRARLLRVLRSHNTLAGDNNAPLHTHAPPTHTPLVHTRTLPHARTRARLAEASRVVLAVRLVSVARSDSHQLHDPSILCVSAWNDNGPERGSPLKRGRRD